MTTGGSKKRKEKEGKYGITPYSKRKMAGEKGEICGGLPTIDSRTLRMSHMDMKKKGEKKGKKDVRLLTYNQFEDIAHGPHAYGN